MTKRRAPIRASSRRRTRSRRALWLGTVTVVAVVAVWAVTRRHSREGIVVVTPAERLSVDDADRAAMALGEAGRNLASLPYFQSVVARAPGDFAAHQNYSTALANAVQESRVHAGQLEAATRSSLVRAAMRRASLFESDVAESLASSPEEIALVISQRAQSLRTWGLPVDALTEYRRALALTPNDTAIARQVRRLSTETGAP